MYNFDTYHSGEKIKDIDVNHLESSFTFTSGQKKSFNRLILIMTKYGFAFESSKMGLGKSVLSSMCALYMNKPMCIICPKDCSGVWRKLAKKAPEFKIRHIYTRETLTGTIRKMPGEDDLVEGFPFARGKKNILKYKPGRELNRLMKKGYFFVIDEAHMCKNDSNINRAVSCLTNKIIKKYKDKNSSVVLLTTALLTEKINFTPLYNLIGLLDDGKLFSGTKNRDKEFSGIKNIVDFCKESDDLETLFIVGDAAYNGFFVNYSNAKMNKMSVDLFKNVIIKSLFSHIESNKSNEFQPESVNMFHKLNIEGGLDNILEHLKELFLQNEKNKKNSLTIFGNALANLEESLIPVFIGIMEDELEKDPNCKVILCMNRKKNVQKVYDHMSERYKRIMKITADESDEKDELIDKFQREDTRYRIIIAITDSIKQSVSLDDRSEGGKRKRILIISPSCKCLDLVQLEGRVFRGEMTTSKAKIYYIYGLPNNTSEIEKDDILNKQVYDTIHFKVIINLSEKEKVAKIFDTSNSIKFPSELPFIFYKDPIYPRR